MLTVGIRLYEYSRPAEQLRNLFPNSAERSRINPPDYVLGSTEIFSGVLRRIYFLPLKAGT